MAKIAFMRLSLASYFASSLLLFRFAPCPRPHVDADDGFTGGRAASRHHQMPRRHASTTCAIQKGADHTGVILPREFKLLRDRRLRSCNAEGVGRRLFVHVLDSAECPTKKSRPETVLPGPKSSIRFYQMIRFSSIP